MEAPKKNACVLPEDLKNFYLMTDGFHMTWSVKSDESPMPLGSMTINGISRLNRLGTSPAYSLPSAPTLADLEEADEEGGDKDQPEKPHLDSRSLIFELDPCGGNGKVCLVYKHTKPAVSPDSEIWFLDRALYWHFLTKTFTAYYRLLIAHLGLPQWQYAFTSYGISPQAKQWFNMYKPITVNTEHLSEEAELFVNKLDPNKVFRSKSKTPVVKKKLPSQPPSQKGQAGTNPKNPPPAGSSSRRREVQS
ncbi:Tubulin polyglutamylase complex subunit 2 [Varanus komodoensis]|nr:Tubulin polyglutamylase complex subunit 2 [Varanus komodoensis]